MNECEYWYANVRGILDQHFARNNEQDLMNQSSFDRDVYWRALVTTKENMPNDHRYYTVCIPKFKSKAKICQEGELPEPTDTSYIYVTFIRLHRNDDNIYLCNIKEVK